MAVRYGWRPGSRIGLDADLAGREMENIRSTHGGQLQAEAVLARASSKNSALHDHFEWDDKKAAHEHRLTQAGELIRAIVVDVSRSNVEEPKLIRAFVSVTQGESRHYTSTLHALSDKDLRAQILDRAWRDLEAWRVRHAELVEFARIFAAIDESKLER